MEKCSEIIKNMLKSENQGNYAYFLAKEMQGYLNNFDNLLATSLEKINGEITGKNKKPRSIFQFKMIIECLKNATNSFEKDLTETQKYKELDRFLHNVQENKKLYMFVPSAKKTDLFLFNVHKSKVEKICINELKDLQNFSSISIGRQIFISGGENAYQVATNQAILLSLKTAKPIIKSPMREARCCHSLALVCKNYIYALGGCRLGKYGREYLKGVEKYNFSKNTWVYSISLSERKSNISTIVFNDRFIYCFGGYRNEGIDIWLNTIEFIDILDEYSGWKIIKGINFKKLYECGITQISNREILLFGGCAERFVWQDNSSIFNHYKPFSMVQNEKKMKQPGKFSLTRVVKLNGKVFALDEDMRDVHIYNNAFRRWFLAPIAELY